MREQLLERIKFLETNINNAQNVVQQAGVQVMQMQGARQECLQMLKMFDDEQVAQPQAPANEAVVAS